jgi:hypothetical protein
VDSREGKSGGGVLAKEKKNYEELWEAAKRL